MKTINYNGEEAVLVKENLSGGFLFLTFLQKRTFGLKIIRMFHDTIFNDLKVEEFSVTDNDLDAIQAFRTNQIDVEELGDRIQLAM